MNWMDADTDGAFGSNCLPKAHSALKARTVETQCMDDLDTFRQGLVSLANQMGSRANSEGKLSGSGTDIKAAIPWIERAAILVSMAESLNRDDDDRLTRFEWRLALVD